MNPIKDFVKQSITNAVASLDQNQKNLNLPNDQKQINPIKNFVKEAIANSMNNINPNNSKVTVFKDSTVFGTNFGRK